MSKTLITAVVAVATLLSSAAGAQPYQGDRHDGDRSRGDNYDGQRDGVGRDGCYRGERDCGQRRTFERQNRQRHYVWRNGRYEDSSGAAVAGGILGFVLGAAIAGSNDDRTYYNSHRYNRGWRNRCTTSYPGFDWRSGTYIGQDGYRHYCTR